MTSHDLPHDLKLSGKPGDDVQSVMTQFRTRVALMSEDTTAPDIVDRRAVRYFHLLVTDAALIMKQQLEAGVLGWRSDSELKKLRRTPPRVTLSIVEPFITLSISHGCSLYHETTVGSRCSWMAL